jgi:FkbM family methyltransferase
MSSEVSGWIKAGARRLGYDIRRTSPESALPADIWGWLRETQRIGTVVDIGAHTGEFAAFLAGYFRPAAVFAFEPLPSCLSALRARAGGIRGLRVFDVALSDETGPVTLYANSYAPSSSVLRVSEASRTEFPETAGETPVQVSTARLDDVLRAGELERDILIKVDVQGVEDRVIRGGVRIFSAARCVLIEMSFVPMYEGQPLFEDVHTLLVNLGFRLGGFRNQVSSRRTGQPLFAHCCYLRPEGLGDLRT